MNEKKISLAVIKRLPRYYRYLSDLLEANITKISSKELSEKMNVTASQIRQDLNCFGGFGQQGYGYNVQSLFSEIGKILGDNKIFNYIIIGAGNIGHALANYPNFEKGGFKLVGIYDSSQARIGEKINNFEIKNISDLTSNVIKEKNIIIAILCVPYERTRQVAEFCTEIGIKGLWNFSPMDLQLQSGVTIENVHLSDSLMVLGYNINRD